MRKAVLFAVKASVSGLLLYLALRNVNFDVIKARLSDISAAWSLAGLAVILVQVALLAARWRLVLGRCGVALAPARALRFTMIALFFNQTLPSSIGGDAIRIWLIGRHANWSAATYSVILDRMIGVVALADMVLICLPWTFALISDPIARAALLTIGLGANAAALVFLALALRPFRFLDRWMPSRHLGAAAKVALSILRAPKSFAPVFVISLLLHALNAVLAWTIAQAVGIDVPLLTLFYLVPPALLVTVIPISIAGWGVRESAMVATFAYAGLSQSGGLLISILYGVEYLLIGLACGALWILPIASVQKDYRAATSAPD